MLVLCRKKHERVMIGEDIVVEVVEIRGGSVRLGFIAPKDLEVHRSEIFQKIQQQQLNVPNQLLKGDQKPT